MVAGTVVSQHTLEHQHTRFGENNTFEDENLLEQWFEIVNEAVSITVNSIYSEFEWTDK
jgi:hypothetical protein